MKTLKYTVLLILLTSLFSCKAQQLNSVATNNYPTEIVGVWIDDSDPNYKLEFTSNGTCKEFEGIELIGTYNYSIENNSCETYSASNTTYLKWVDVEDQEKVCFHIEKITSNTLSLMIIDKAKILFFNRQ